jgi:hypothetical protein
MLKNACHLFLALFQFFLCSTVNQSSEGWLRVARKDGDDERKSSKAEDRMVRGGERELEGRDGCSGSSSTGNRKKFAWSSEGIGAAF